MTMKPAILAIEDTRQRDDDGKIIADSGSDHACDICGRAHYIHVILTDGRRIGQSCAKKARIIHWEPRYFVEHRTVVIDNASKSPPMFSDSLDGWARSLANWAEKYPIGTVEMFDRALSRFKTLASGGKVHDNPQWQWME